MSVKFAATLVAVALLAISSVSALKVAWQTTLPATTAAPKGVSSGYSALFGTPATPNEFYGISTSNGNLTLLYAGTGAVLWSVGNWNCSAMSLCWERQVVGDDRGLVVLQGSEIYFLALLDGSTTRQIAVPSVLVPSAASLSLSRRWGGELVLFDGSTLVALSRDSGALIWQQVGLNNEFGSSIRTDNGESGTISFIQTCAHTPSAWCVRAAQDKSGAILFTHVVPNNNTQFLYMSAVDHATLFFMNTAASGDTFACRMSFNQAEGPHYCALSCGGNDYVHGYGLAADKGGRVNMTRMYLDLTNGTQAFNFTSGALIATTPPRIHPGHAHLVGMSQYAFVGLQESPNTLQLLGYTFETMKLRFNFSVTSASPIDVYSVSGNWYNEILVPVQDGFFMLFGANSPTPTLNSEFASALKSTGGTVLSNTWVTENRAFITSGNSVIAYAFSASG